MVGSDQQGQRIIKVTIRRGKERWVHVPMRGDDGQRANAGVQLEGDTLLLGVRVKVTIGRALDDHRLGSYQVL